MRRVLSSPAVGIVCALIYGGCADNSPATSGDLAGLDAAIASGPDASIPLDASGLDSNVGADARGFDAQNDAPPSTADAGGLVMGRPYPLKVPTGYNAAQPTPLVIGLHAYGSTGMELDTYFGLSAVADAKKFLFAYPDGTIDPFNTRFWNATDACCDKYSIAVDDVAYLNAVIDDITAHYNVDPKRIFVFGYANGGFMAHRMACDSPRIAAAVSVGGAQWNNIANCKPAGPVAVLEVHGDADADIVYTGGSISGKTYPSSAQTMADWASLDGCNAAITSPGVQYDLDSVLAGQETTVGRYTGCMAGGAAELWTMAGGSHMPMWTATATTTIYGFLSTHPKP